MSTLRASKIIIFLWIMLPNAGYKIVIFVSWLILNNIKFKSIRNTTQLQCFCWCSFVAWQVATPNVYFFITTFYSKILVSKIIYFPLQHIKGQKIWLTLNLTIILLWTSVLIWPIRNFLEIWMQLFKGKKIEILIISRISYNIHITNIWYWILNILCKYSIK